MYRSSSANAPGSMRSRVSEPRLGTSLLYSISPSNTSSLSLLPLSFSRLRFHRLSFLLSSRFSLASLAKRLGSLQFHGTRTNVTVHSRAQRDVRFRRCRGGNPWDWGNTGRRWSCGSKSKDFIWVLVVDGISRFLGED